MADWLDVEERIKAKKDYEKVQASAGDPESSPG
jgi:hypothetical protein